VILSAAAALAASDAQKSFEQLKALPTAGEMPALLLRCGPETD